MSVAGFLILYLPVAALWGVAIGLGVALLIWAVGSVMVRFRLSKLPVRIVSAVAAGLVPAVGFALSWKSLWDPGPPWWAIGVAFAMGPLYVLIYRPRTERIADRGAQAGFLTRGG